MINLLPQFIRVTSFAACLIASLPPSSRAMEGLAAVQSEMPSVSGVPSPEVQKALNETAELLYKCSILQQAKETGFTARDFRDNQLVPAIKKTSALAISTQNPELLYCSFALASCEMVPSQSFEWASDLTSAASVFPPAQVKEISARIEEPGRKIIIAAIKYQSPSSPLISQIASVPSTPLPPSQSGESAGAWTGSAAK